MKVLDMPVGTYVVAVSGGVDSVVLLDLLVKQGEGSSDSQLIVAHVDHGIRPDSAADARFVAGLAEYYGLPFESCVLQLGKNAGEEQARRERYAWLSEIAKRHAATAITTAHHKGDIVETIVHNLLRGTGWRGLCSLRAVSGEESIIVRPLLESGKQDIIAYAVSQRLEWCEDTTNQMDAYMRNRLRHHVIPACERLDPAFATKMIGLWRAQCSVRGTVEAEVAAACDALSVEGKLAKTPLATLEPALAIEMLRHFLLRHGIRQTRPQLARALQFLHVARTGKQFSLNRTRFLVLRSVYLVVENRENCYHR